MYIWIQWKLRKIKIYNKTLSEVHCNLIFISSAILQVSEYKHLDVKLIWPQFTH